MATTVADVLDVTDAAAAAEWLTDYYATGVARQAWERDRTPMPAFELVNRVLADPDPPEVAVLAALALRRQLMEAAERVDTEIVELARQRRVPWEVIGASVGVTKQAAFQRHARRTRPRRPGGGGGGGRPGGRREPVRTWLDENARRLRALARDLLSSHGSELRDVNITVATAVHRLGIADYQGGDREVLECARLLLAAVDDALEASKTALPWDQVTLSPRVHETLGELRELLRSAPDHP
ncbi:hypothetical protein [Thermobispora bispora]|uniref:hypothetical protein n=1 Tax=Thermobispora bispora TaxID=2006 RepID=UPI00197DAB7A|nr:hypothetical protein [Thermobispora bispora]QSI49929.1 hypothetical protein CYL17_18280 [Thermobispora bispora]QSI50031.1 hypothetical protein CYL17_18850 [Thermobispora bispora]